MKNKIGNLKELQNLIRTAGILAIHRSLEETNIVIWVFWEKHPDGEFMSVIRYAAQYNSVVKEALPELF